MKNQIEKVNNDAQTAFSYLRFSTPEQSMGDSERRQIALARAYCQQHSLKLANCAADKGVSGFHGRNHQNGALGALLKQMRPGQVLLIEDCDRWSREPALDSLLRLREEVFRGIEVVFLRTGTRVTAENFNDLNVIVPNFFSSLLGHQESAKKAERIRAVCQERKEQVKAGKRVQLFRVPFWLEWKDGNYVLLPEETRAVERMFKLAAEGHSIVEIVGRLKGRWCSKTVARTLVNKAVIGFCGQVQPPVAEYFPAAVTEELFYRAQSKITLTKQCRRHKGNETNIFTGLVKCALCGCPLVAHSSEHGARARLICSGRIKGRSKCDTRGAPLELMEKSFLSLAANADLLRPLLMCQEQKPSRVDELQARLLDAEKQAAKLAKLILGDDDPSPMIYSQLKLEEAKAKGLRAEVEAEQGRERAQQPALLAYCEFIASLPMLAKDAAQRPDLRRAVASLVDWITLDPHGQKGRWDYCVQFKGATAPVTVICVAKPEGWLFQSLRPSNIPAATCAVVTAGDSDQLAHLSTVQL